jgi:hypothetical protein
LGGALTRPAKAQSFYTKVIGYQPTEVKLGGQSYSVFDTDGTARGSWLSKEIPSR